MLQASQTVYSHKRDPVSTPIVKEYAEKLNKRNKTDGIVLLKSIKDNSIPTAFFDPQYRGVLDHLSYGNEGKNRGKERSSLPQMIEVIPDFIQELSRILIPSGHLFLWIDKFHLLEGFQEWLNDTPLHIVDMLTWNKDRMGMGYRTRRFCEYLVVIQKNSKESERSVDNS